MRVQRTIEVLEALVGFDTTSRNSNLALVEWVEAYLDRFGVAHERVPDKTGSKANVWATTGPSGMPGTILSGHTDVVPVDGQSWSTDPFRLTERNGRLFGRGATDNGGSDVFVHVHDVEAAGMKILEAGQLIAYEVGPARDGRSKAVNLRLLNP